ncbi:Ku protein [Bradyrhizobium sp.]|uniref:non-homologous end joining protein Ku n=1 Tax=Bradyrhizobium sp. TaxID=376 RepID=UPI002D6709CA|nr:Ku protein [Bradyrhizobium sp.]HZR77016.1 Ku protein [Bradyrhizobium sp.]
MAPRPYWKGYLKLSLVSCQVALYPAASRSERIALHQISKRTGHRLRQQMVDEQTGDVVDREEKGRGYEVSRDQYVPLDEEELDKIALASTHTIDIEHFVPRGEIDERYFDSPYYLAPIDEVGQEAFIVIREAMRDKKMVGIGRVVLYRRERILMLEPFDKGLLATTLRYGYEVRDAEPYFEGIPDIDLPTEMRKLASHIIETKAAHFEPAAFVDRYEKALADLVKSKQAGLPPPRERPRRESARVINLMDALKRSVASESGSAKSPKRSAGSAGESRRNAPRGTARRSAARRAS